MKDDSSHHQITAKLLFGFFSIAMVFYGATYHEYLATESRPIVHVMTASIAGLFFSYLSSKARYYKPTAKWLWEGLGYLAELMLLAIFILIFLALTGGGRGSDLHKPMLKFGTVSSLEFTLLRFQS